MAGGKPQLAAPSKQLPQHPWALAISPDTNPTPDNPVFQSLKLDADLSILRPGVVNRVGAPSGEQVKEGREGGQLRALGPHVGALPASSSV